MSAEITVPQMGESITEATIGTILKENGSQVKMDEEILELETDKVNQAIYAPCDGVLNLSIQVDDVVKIGQKLGEISSNGAASASPAPAPEAKKEKEAPTPTASTELKVAPVATSNNGSTVRKSRDEGLKDLLSETKTPAAPAPAPVAAAAPAPQSVGERSESRRRMSRIRQVIAKRLVETQQNTAMLTTFNEVDMSAVMALRSKYKDSFEKQHDARLGFLSFFIKASVSAMQAFPDINAYIDETEIVQRNYFDIGVAVGTDRGLLVPVLRDCDQKTFAQIEQGIIDFAKRARTGGLGVDELQGGGFTITNGGIYGSMLSTPILNQGQSGILGMHNIVKRAVVVNDEIVIRPMMYLALSYDHRIVDGKEAVSFLVHVKNCLEDPTRLILNV
ncbi:MAG: dihydrolipoyllysine-residue succinyltransferase [Waddliaceae bacterium]|nr:dihydrolipoyllysine-residue succinyltransferase [Waddliaceae bacterium]